MVEYWNNGIVRYSGQAKFTFIIQFDPSAPGAKNKAGSE
jgi:hypothetical protein